MSTNKESSNETVTKAMSVQQQQPDAPAPSKRGRRKKEVHNYPVEPRVIQVLKKHRSYVNHSYRDFSSVPPELSDKGLPEKIEDMTFNQKVHHLLSVPEYSKLITWQPHGRAFRVVVPKALERDRIIEKYLGHNRFSSFLRQLSNHGYKHISTGPDRNCYYHEYMLRGMPHLSKYMPQPKDARRLIADPANEPDFYAISQLYPLADSGGATPSNVAATTAAAADKSARLASQTSFELPAAKRRLLALTRPEFTSLAAATPLVSAANHPLLSQQSVLLSQLQQQQQQQAKGHSQQQLLAAAMLKASLLNGSGASQPRMVAPPQMRMPPTTPSSSSSDAMTKALAALLQQSQQGRRL